MVMLARGQAWNRSGSGRLNIIQKISVHTLTRFSSLGISRFRKRAIRWSYVPFISFFKHSTLFQAALVTLTIFCPFLILFLLISSNTGQYNLGKLSDEHLCIWMLNQV